VLGRTDDLRAAAQEWAERTAAAQGLPPQVTQADVIRTVTVLLDIKPVRSGTPDRGKPRRIETVVTPSRGTNDDVIEDGGDDLLLPSER
jgi:hypothetical protein